MNTGMLSPNDGWNPCSAVPRLFDEGMEMTRKITVTRFSVAQGMGRLGASE